MISGLVLPCAVRRLTYSRVGWWNRMRTIAMRYNALFASRSPPRLRRCRLVLPDDAGTGQTPASFANAASERSRCGLSPAAVSSWAATVGPTPKSPTNAGAALAVRVASSSSASLTPGLDRRRAHDLELTDDLDGAVTPFRFPARNAGKGSTCRRDGVDSVGLAVTATGFAIRSGRPRPP